ncbi:MAG: protein kinase [Nocardioides sp.]|uniref:serine/threonine-protein kinase n=1 Tax=Nocardioides sp. TaxID=35761 RepID=UPI003F0990F8
MIAGRYTLVRELGRGGSGAVHLATDEVLGRPVALKRMGIAPGANTPDAERSAREARISAALSHRNIVAVYDLAIDDGVQWLVMEYVEGRTLAELIRAEGGLSPARTAALLSQVADALAEAHRRGIVHRDVKPSNIFVAADGSAKLGDFGIARGKDDAALTRTGLVTGSPAYLAPELVSGASATPASDLWALGATIFHTLAGEPPYDLGDNLVTGLLRIAQDEPPRLRDAGGLGPVLDATMTKDPAARWTARQVATALRVERDRLATSPLAAPARRPAAQVDHPSGATAVQPVPVGGRAPEGAATPDVAPAPRRHVVPALLAACALVAAVVFGAMALSGDGDPGAGSTVKDTPSANGTTPTASDPTDQASDDPAADTAATEAAMEAFIGDYLATVTSDPEEAFGLLTPAFQAESGGLEGYLGWWRTVRDATLLNIKADAETLEVSYSVKYDMKDGGKSTSRVNLQLERLDDSYRIAGEG